MTSRQPSMLAGHSMLCPHETNDTMWRGSRRALYRRQWSGQLLFELLREAFGGGFSPSCHERRPQRRLRGRAQNHVGGAAASPATFYGDKDLRFGLHEGVLLFRGKLHHGQAVAGIAESRKYFSAHAEIGVLHVRLLRCLRETEGHTAKILRSHSTPSSLTFCITNR